MCKHCYFCFSQLGTAYVSATTGAVATALGLNALTKVTLILFPILTQILVCYEMSRFSPGSVSCCAQLPLWSCDYLWQLPSLVPDLIFLPHVDGFVYILNALSLLFSYTHCIQ